MGKLDEILERFLDRVSDVDAETNERWGHDTNCGLISTGPTKETIKKVFIDLLPEKSKSTCVCDRDACWNDAIDEITKRIQSL